MKKEILQKNDLNNPREEAMSQIAGIVKRTLGPGGLPIIIERVGQALDGSPLGPKITKDGVSVAEECSSTDANIDVVMQAIKSICKKTNKDAGDGTTTAIVLGEAIFNSMNKEIKDILNSGDKINPQLVKNEVEASAKKVFNKLIESSIPVKDINMIKQVATISANGDEEIGSIIAQAFDKVGAEGVVTVDEGKTNKVTLSHVDGYQFNRGAESRTNFFNDKSKTKYEATEAEIIIYDGTIQSYHQLIPALNTLAGFDGEKATKKIPPLVIIANDFTSEVIQFLLIQKMEMGLNIVPIKGPHTTTVRSEYYEDIAAYTGGFRLGNGQKSLDQITSDDFGTVEKIVVDKYTTTLYGGYGSEETILERVDTLTDQKRLAESAYDAQVINDRLAALTSGVAKIAVGGSTELEIKEKYDRIEDALNAARAAIQEGIIPGGGSTLLRISESDILDSKNIGDKILKRALKAPFTQILLNLGYDNKEIKDLSKKVISCKNNKLVFDAFKYELTDALTRGIIDPVKVTRTAFENALSISTLLSTAGGAIVYKKDS